MSTDHSSSRRNFIKTSAKAGIALTAAGTIASIQSLAATSHPDADNAPFFTSFDQQPLPYGYGALEPSIDARTMEIHFTKHAATYSTMLKEAAKAEGVSTDKPLEDVLAGISKYSAKMRNNGGGHYNHEMFWKLMKTKGEGKPSGKLLASIESTFISFNDFKTQFTDAAKTRFGSGWAWLYLDGEKKLKIGSTPNQDNPLMDVSEIKGFPLLGLDVWEHAYYLKYQNKRPDYIENWWNVVNWSFVASRYAQATAK